MSWLTKGNPSGLVKIGARHYMLKNGVLYRPSKREAVLRVVITALLLGAFVLAAGWLMR